MAQSRKPSLFGRWFGRSEETPRQVPSETPSDNSFAQEQLKEKREPTFEQQLQLQQLEDELFCRSLNPNDPLHGFEKGYHNTLKGYRKQVGQGAFEDPESITDFTVDFAKRYLDARKRMQEEQELLVDPWDQGPKPQAPTAGPPSYPDWKKTVQTGEMLQSSPLPSWLTSGFQTMIGAKTHITKDLQPSLDTAFEKKQARSPGAKRADLEKDFATGGQPFRETTRKTGEELGIPGVFTTIGEPIVGVQRQRDDQFSQWEKKETDH